MQIGSMLCACLALGLAYAKVKATKLNQALCVAASRGNTAVVERLLKQEASPDAVGSIGDPDCDCEDNSSPSPALTLAIYQTSGGHHEHLETAAALLHAGADVNAKGDAGMTALMWATSPRMTAFLLAHGANVNLKDDHGDTALAIQDANQSKDISRLLKQAGAT